VELVVQEAADRVVAEETAAIRDEPGVPDQLFSREPLRARTSRSQSARG
jgi:hypothetical protein